MKTLYSGVNVSALVGLKSLVPQNRAIFILRYVNFYCAFQPISIIFCFFIFISVIIIIITELIVREGCRGRGSESPRVLHVRIAVGMRSFSMSNRLTFNEQYCSGSLYIKIVKTKNPFVGTKLCGF